MGFFGDLKQDLSQAVNELLPEENENTEALQTEDANEAETLENKDLDLEKMLEDALAGEIDVSDSAEAEVSDQTTESAIDDAFADLEAISQQAAAEAEAVKEEIVEEPKYEAFNKGDIKKMDSNFDRQVSDETSVITPGMTVNGDVTTEGSLEILGTVSGNIDVAGKLNVTGHVNGNSKAHEIFAENAKITGDVVSESSIKIGAGTVIVGNISGFSAAVAGAVKGDIDVHGPVILDSSAIVMGNIRSKSVQINNGAAIEGMCSQCYADVSPTSFFDDYKVENGKKSK